MQPIGSYWDAGSPWSPVSKNSCAKPAGLQKGLFENTVAVRCSLPQIITMLVECKERPFLIPCFFFFFCIEVASMSHYAPSGSKASQMLELVSRFWTNSEASWEFHQMRDDAGPESRRCSSNSAIHLNKSFILSEPQFLFLGIGPHSAWLAGWLQELNKLTSVKNQHMG